VSAPVTHRPDSSPRRVRDLLVALGIHVAALPLWLIQALLWDFPGQTPEQSARTDAAIAVYAVVVMAAYMALFVALIAWWRQGRQRLFLSPLVGAGVAWCCPCLAVLVFVPSVRRALVPRRPAPEVLATSPRDLRC